RASGAGASSTWLIMESSSVRKSDGGGLTGRGGRRPAISTPLPSRMSISAREPVRPAMGGRPCERFGKEGTHRGEGARVELLPGLGFGEDIGPGGEAVKGQAGLREGFLRARIDAVEEDDRDMGDLRARLAQGIGEGEFGAAVGCEILDEEDARAVLHLALDPGIAAEA